MIKLAVDAMGGDFAPDVIIEGISKYTEGDTHFMLVGDEDKIKPLLTKFGVADDRYDLIHTSEFVGMGESPKSKLDKNPDVSIALAAKLVADKKADALLSAGNTGAVVLAASRHIPLIGNIQRCALAGVYPVRNFKDPSDSGDKISLMLDCGATIKCESTHLVHFAYMGHNYLKSIFNIQNPKVALLNMGSEELKGGDTLQTAYRKLEEDEHINFIGNIEGNDLLTGKADIIVTEGFTGNIAVKMLEGVAESLAGLAKFAFNDNLKSKAGIALLGNGIRKVKKKFDYSEYGGAPILGFEGLCIKAHGKSNAKAITNAIKLCADAVRNDLSGKLKHSIEEI